MGRLWRLQQGTLGYNSDKTSYVISWLLLTSRCRCDGPVPYNVISNKDTLSETLFLGTKVAKQLACFQGDRQDVTSDCPASPWIIEIEISRPNLKQFKTLLKSFTLIVRKCNETASILLINNRTLSGYSLSASRKRHIGDKTLLGSTLWTFRVYI